MKYIFACATMVFATSGFAEVCKFTTECFEGEACSDTAFEMTVEDGQMITDAETISVSLGGSDTVRVYVGVTDSAFHLLTSTDDGARYSTHLYDGPMMVNYIGACTE